MVSQLEPGKLYRYDGNGQQFVFMCLCAALANLKDAFTSTTTRATILTGLGGTGTWPMAKRCDLFVDMYFQAHELDDNITEVIEPSENGRQGL